MNKQGDLETDSTCVYTQTGSSKNSRINAAVSPVVCGLVGRPEEFC